MHDDSESAWDEIAQVFARSRAVSADKLVEWPAQLRLASPFVEKRVLDVGCGTGEKASHFAAHGASSVVAIDPSRGFLEDWKKRQGPTLSFLRGSFQNLREVVQHQRFDLIVCFQALMYAKNLYTALETLSELLAEGGVLTVSVPHPFRFAILRSEREGWPLGVAYQKTESYSYPSPWKSDVHLTHSMPRVSDYLNAFAKAGLVIEQSEEPPVTEEFRRVSQEKAAWMDRYIGIIVFRLRRSCES